MIYLPRSVTCHLRARGISAIQSARMHENGVQPACACRRIGALFNNRERDPVHMGRDGQVVLSFIIEGYSITYDFQVPI
jgi:hypothetical protein